MQKIIINLFLSLLLLPLMASADGSKIVKWVDSNGVTHYGDKLPPQEAGRNNVEMSSKGTVVKKNIKVDQKTEIIDQERAKLKADQERSDKILLASYTNANEIDLARDRSLDLDKSALTSFATQKENLTARIKRNNAVIDGFKTRKKPLPDNLDKEFKDAIAQSNRIDQQIIERKLAMETTRKNYANDKARFVILKQPVLVNSTEQKPLEPIVAGEKNAATPAVVPTVEKIQVEKIQADKSQTMKK
jgi:Domain of unknown function (DUF4124)